jgi:hypothetical protein
MSQNAGLFANFSGLVAPQFPCSLLRFYYVVATAGEMDHGGLYNCLTWKDLAPRARFELATLRLTAGGENL